MASRFQHSQAYRGVSLRRLSHCVAMAAMATAGDVAAAETPPPAAKPGPQTAVDAAAIPDEYKLNMLIRTTLIALSQANQTGNYSVLRDLGTPQFQAMNTDARLVEIFAGLRQRNLDLSPVVFFDPKLIRPPALQANGVLRMTGFIDSKPERVLFDMGFQSVQGQWRLAAIVVDMKPAPPAPAQPNTAQPPAMTPKKDAAVKPTNKSKGKPAKAPVSVTAP